MRLFRRKGKDRSPLVGHMRMRSAPAASRGIGNAMELPKGLPSTKSGMQRVPEDRTGDGMLYVAGGTFRMGSDRHYPEEAPVHSVTVDGFWMDRTPVTNRQFRKFINATGYVTFAELTPDPKDYPDALPHMLYPGSLVFTPPRPPVA